MAFLDPPKEGAGRAIAALRRHGIGVKILTGDNEVITRKVCVDVGVPVTGLVHGASSNFGNMLSVIGASAWLPFLPMAPMQVLANNLLYDLSQTSIPSDNVDNEYLLQPRRWEIANIGRHMLLVGPISSLFDYATFCLMYCAFAANTRAHSALFQTGVVRRVPPLTDIDQSLDSHSRDPVCP